MLKKNKRLTIEESNKMDDVDDNVPNTDNLEISSTKDGKNMNENMRFKIITL